MGSDSAGARGNDSTTDGIPPSDMMQNMIARRRLYVGIVLVVALLGIASIAISAVRRPILRAAGWALVVNDRVEPSDVIVVTVDADGAGVLEAADLVQSGVAPRVAVFGEPPDSVEREFIRRGIPYEDEAARSVRRLRALGVVPVELIPTFVAGSEDEGPVLADWCDQHSFRSVVVVSTSDHITSSPPSASSFHEGPPDESHSSFLTLLGVRSQPMVAIAPRDPN